eukprot:TRINITY_DN6341_c0_g1_i2.p1 TRINITY_DN6341_c0_g1~~TRINITY_DN6341_c0_g1_i2.p1  ORF type:complete len:103 (-),score=26.71 TRINITY_DN6341_c0_g1_i2:34-342(-)
MANQNKEITVAAIYQSTGKPSPEAIKLVYNSLLKKNYAENVNMLIQLMHDKGLALDDIMNGVYRLVSGGEFPVRTKAKLIEDMSEIESVSYTHLTLPTICSV